MLATNMFAGMAHSTIGISVVFNENWHYTPSI
jgi:hypothetical protein